MFNRKKKAQKAFKQISKYIEKSKRLSGQEKYNLQGLLKNIQTRSGVTR